MNNKRPQDRGLAHQKPPKQGRDRLAAIPAWLKSCFVKFWIAGAIFFFMMMSELSLTIARLDIIAILGLILGLFINLLINKVLRAFDIGDGAHLKYMVFPAKKYIFFLVNVIYGLVCVMLVALIYGAINMIVNFVAGYPPTTIKLPVEPLGFGVAFVLVDYIFVLSKLLLFKLLKLSHASQDTMGEDDEIIEEAAHSRGG